MMTKDTTTATAAANDNLAAKFVSTFLDRESRVESAFETLIDMHETITTVKRQFSISSQGKDAHINYLFMRLRLKVLFYLILKNMSCCYICKC